MHDVTDTETLAESLYEDDGDVSVGARLVANAHLETSTFDSDADEEMLLCKLPFGERGLRFALPRDYIDLIERFDGSRDTDDVVKDYLATYSGKRDDKPADWWNRLARESLQAKGLLVAVGDDPKMAGRAKQKGRAFLYVKLPVFRPALVQWISRRLRFFFSPVVVMAAIAGFIAMHAVVYGYLFPTHGFSLDSLSTADLALIMLFSTLGTIVHEFGHSGAAARYGCRNMEIGWGIYLIYTVLWSDVSDAWKLPRAQRAMVDAGGVYLECYFLLVMFVSYFATGNTVFLFAFIFINLSMATTLNPFLRMDAYWFLSDLFGIVNLRERQVRWVESLVTGQTATDQVGLSRRAKLFLGWYSVLGTVFMSCLVYFLYRYVIFDVAVGMPGRLADYAANAGGYTFLQHVDQLLEIGWRSVTLLGGTLLAFAVVRMVGRVLRLLVRAVTIRTGFGRVGAAHG